jgi:hypothetical protein
LLGARVAQHRVDQPVKLAAQIGVAHRTLNAADRVLDEHVQLAAVLAGDGDVGGLLVYSIVDAGPDAVAQCDYVGPGDDFIGERVLADLAEHDARRARVVDAEFGFEPGARRGLAGQLEHQ